MKKFTDMLDELVDTQTQLPATIYFKFDAKEDTKYVGQLYAIINDTVHIKFLNKKKRDKTGEWVMIKVNVHRNSFLAEIDHENTEHFTETLDAEIKRGDQ